MCKPKPPHPCHTCFKEDAEVFECIGKHACKCGGGSGGGGGGGALSKLCFKGCKAGLYTLKTCGKSFSCDEVKGGELVYVDSRAGGGKDGRWCIFCNESKTEWIGALFMDIAILSYLYCFEFFKELLGT